MKKEKEEIKADIKSNMKKDNIIILNIKIKMARKNIEGRTLTSFSIKQKIGAEKITVDILLILCLKH